MDTRQSLFGGSDTAWSQASGSTSVSTPSSKQSKNSQTLDRGISLEDTFLSCNLSNPRPSHAVSYTSHTTQSSHISGTLSATGHRSHSRSNMRVEVDEVAKHALGESLYEKDQDALLSYIPKVIQRALKGKDVEVRHHTASAKAAVAFVDVCGFTQITEMMRKSPDGSCGIAEHLNSFFTVLLRVINERGGDVIQFSGDALLAVWWSSQDAALLEASAQNCLRAVAQILYVSRDTHIALDDDSPQMRLGVHIGMAVGDIELSVVGGTTNTDGSQSWRHVATGSSITHAVSILDFAVINEAAISPQMHAMLKGDSETGLPPLYGLSLEARSSHGSGFIATLSDPQAVTLPFMQGDSESGSLIKKQKQGVGHVAHELRAAFGGEEGKRSRGTTSGDTALLKWRVYSFIFDAILGTWGHQGELRTVSTVFIHIAHASDDTSVTPQLLHEAVSLMQIELMQRDGILNKLLYDDKGITLLCLFGLPGHCHSDDAIRAVAFSRNTCTQLESLRLCGSYGISRSKVYCGVCGSDFRREYTVLGDGVNTAARVMQYAVREGVRRRAADNSHEHPLSDFPNGESPPSSLGTVFVDDATRTLSKSNFAFSMGSDMRFKGKKLHCKVWELEDSSFMTSESLSFNTSGQHSPSAAGLFRALATVEGKVPKRNRKERTSGKRKDGSLQRSDTMDSEGDLSDDDANLGRAPSLSLTSPEKADDNQEVLIEAKDSGATPSLFGREEQLSSVRELLRHLKAVSQSDNPTLLTHPCIRAVCVTGDEATGKTAFLTRCIEITQEQGVRVLPAACNSLEADTPFHALSTLMLPFAKHPIGWLARDIDMENPELRPLLRFLFPALVVPDSETVAVLPDEERLDKVSGIAKGILARSCEGSPVLLCIDDLQWGDPESLASITDIVRSLPNTAVLCSLRSETHVATENASPNHTGYVRNPMYLVNPKDIASVERHIESVSSWGGANAFAPRHHGDRVQVLLPPLQLEDLRKLLTNVMGCPVHHLVVSTIYSKTGGNPGFSEQLLESLCDNEVEGSSALLVINEKDGVAQFAPGVRVEELRLPEGIEGVITGRFDKLTHLQKTCLKVASVIGNTFSLHLLCHVLRRIAMDKASPTDPQPAVETLAQYTATFRHTEKSLGNLEVLGFLTRFSSDHSAPDGPGSPRLQELGKRSNAYVKRRLSNNSNAVARDASCISFVSSIPVGDRGSLSSHGTGKQASMMLNDDTPGAAVPDDVIFSFRLHLMRDVLYSMLLAKDRREIHGKVAETLEVGAQAAGMMPYQSTPPAVPENGIPMPIADLPVLVRHFENAGLEERTIIYLGSAAEAEMSRGQHAQSLHSITRALRISRELPEENPYLPQRSLICHFIALQALLLYSTHSSTPAFTSSLIVLHHAGESYAASLEAAWRDSTASTALQGYGDFAQASEGPSSVSCCCCGGSSSRNALPLPLDFTRGDALAVSSMVQGGDSYRRRGCWLEGSLGLSIRSKRASFTRWATLRRRAREVSAAGGAAGGAGGDCPASPHRASPYLASADSSPRNSPILGQLLHEMPHPLLLDPAPPGLDPAPALPLRWAGGSSQSLVSDARLAGGGGRTAAAGGGTPQGMLAPPAPAARPRFDYRAERGGGGGGGSSLSPVDIYLALHTAALVALHEIGGKWASFLISRAIAAHSDAQASLRADPGPTLAAPALQDLHARRHISGKGGVLHALHTALSGNAIAQAMQQGAASVGQAQPSRGDDPILKYAELLGRRVGGGGGDGGGGGGGGGGGIMLPTLPGSAEAEEAVRAAFRPTARLFPGDSTGVDLVVSLALGCAGATEAACAALDATPPSFLRLLAHQPFAEHHHQHHHHHHHHHQHPLLGRQRKKDVRPSCADSDRPLGLLSCASSALLMGITCQPHRALQALSQLLSEELLQGDQSPLPMDSPEASPIARRGCHPSIFLQECSGRGGTAGELHPILRVGDSNESSSAGPSPEQMFARYVVAEIAPPPSGGGGSIQACR